TYRANYNMADQVANDNTSTASENSQEMITAADLAKLRDNGKTLTPQELKELNTRIKALEEMACMEDRLRALESRKRPRTTKSVLPDNLMADLQLEPRNSGYSQDHQGSVHSLIESDSNSESSSSDTVTRYRHKR